MPSSETQTTLTPLQTESANLRAINGTLEATAASLTAISDNLHVLAENTRNANSLAKIYTDIHDHNRRLGNVITEPVEIVGDVDSHMEKLNKRISDLKHQINALN